MKTNPDMPQIPTGTMVALVRQMILIDSEGELVATHLTESVQLRMYRRIVDDESDYNEEHAQVFHEFLMDRKQLFANECGGLRSEKSEDIGFGFGAQTELTGGDPFDSTESIRDASQGSHPLENCIMCHRSAGVYSINSISEIFESARLQSLRIVTPESEKKKVVEQRKQFEMPSSFVAPATAEPR